MSRSYDWRGTEALFPLHLFDHTTGERSVLLSPAHVIQTFEMDWHSDDELDMKEHSITACDGRPIDLQVGDHVLDRLTASSSEPIPEFTQWMASFQYVLIHYSLQVEKWDIWAT